MITACLVLKHKVYLECKMFSIFYSPCNVGHRKVSSDSVIKALGVVGHMVKIPDCLPRLGHITVPHLRNDFAPDYLVTIRLKHQVATGYVNNLGNIIKFTSNV